MRVVLAARWFSWLSAIPQFLHFPSVPFLNPGHLAPSLVSIHCAVLNLPPSPCVDSLYAMAEQHTAGQWVYCRPGESRARAGREPGESRAGRRSAAVRITSLAGALPYAVPRSVCLMVLSLLLSLCCCSCYACDQERACVTRQSN